MLKNLMKKPMAKDLAAEELEQAEKSLLEAQAAAEYALAMCQYHQGRIKRLQTYLGGTAVTATAQVAIEG